MYGHGAAPPPRSTATVTGLRVLFVGIGLLTCGMLASVPLFRVAVLRGKWFDWALAWVSLPLAISCLAVIGSLPETDRRSDVALGGVVLLGAFSAAYFLIVDIRHHTQPSLPVYMRPQGPPAGYGYPQPASPYAATQPQTPQARVPQSPVPQPQPQPQRPAPVRIDQVRAELDELSDYLRKHDGTPEDGR